MAGYNYRYLKDVRVCQHQRTLLYVCKPLSFYNPHTYISNTYLQPNHSWANNFGATTFSELCERGRLCVILSPHKSIRPHSITQTSCCCPTFHFDKGKTFQQTEDKSETISPLCQPKSQTGMATARERDALSSRILPQMTLSKGDEASPTCPPAPASRFLKAQERAAKRFEVHGNAM